LSHPEQRWKEKLVSHPCARLVMPGRSAVDFPRVKARWSQLPSGPLQARSSIGDRQTPQAFVGGGGRSWCDGLHRTLFDPGAAPDRGRPFAVANRIAKENGGFVGRLEIFVGLLLLGLALVTIGVVITTVMARL